MTVSKETIQNQDITDLRKYSHSYVSLYKTIKKDVQKNHFIV